MSLVWNTTYCDICGKAFVGRFAALRLWLHNLIEGPAR